MKGIGLTVVEEPFEERWEVTASDGEMANGSWYVMRDHMAAVDGIERAAGRGQNNWQEERRLENLLADTVISLLHMEGHPKKEVPLRKMGEGFWAD